MADEAKTALLIDFENLVLGLEAGHEDGATLPVDVGVLATVAQHYGPIAVGRAYADWRVSAFNRFQGQLAERDVTLVHVPARHQKNAVDVRMAVEAMELLYERPEIRTFVVVSGDRDFSHLYHRLRARERTVIAVSPERAASDELARLVDRFVTYEALLRTFRGDGSGGEGDGTPLDELGAELGLLLARHAPDGIVGAALKPLIREHVSPSFDEANYGYAKLSSLLRAMPHVVRVEEPEGEGDIHVLPVMSPVEAARHAAEVGLALPDPAEAFVERFIQRARERLTQWRYDWDAERRRRILEHIHRFMADEGTFTQDEVIQRVRQGPLGRNEGLSTTQLSRYLSVLYQSLIFDVSGEDSDLPVRSRRLTLRAEYVPRDEFIARYEQSILYKLAELLPEDDKQAVRAAAAVLGLPAKPGERRTYVVTLLKRATGDG